MFPNKTRDIGFSIFGSVALFVILIAGGYLYSAFGSSSRDSLVTTMLINAIMVVGMQIYIGNTGVLSFGHIGFGAIAGYAFAALAIDVKSKSRVIPDAPFGVSNVELNPALAGVVAITITLGVAIFVGIGLARSGAKSGAVSATVITLALLFVTHQLGVNWTDLTGGDRIGLSFGIGDTLQSDVPVLVALFLTIVLARLFRQSSVGKLAEASREDNLAARAMGVNPAVQQMDALMVSVFVVALASSLRVYEIGNITPKFFYFDYTLLTLVMLIVGGRKSVSGALTGVVVITVGMELTRYLAGPSVDIPMTGWILRSGLSQIFLGGSMVGFMIFRSDGLLNDWELDQWMFRRWASSHETEASSPSQAGHKKDVVLRAEGLTVDFGGFRALDNASLTASSGEVVGLIGPNGAGKTTLVNVITGMVEPTEGRYSLGGKELAGAAAHEISRAGMVRTFQNLRLFGSMTVRENVEAASIVSKKHRSEEIHPDVDELLVLSGLWEHRHRRASELDYGNSRRLELARAAATSPDFLLLDEPTSGMSDSESVAMIEQVRKTAGAVDAGVLVIDHDLAFITGISDRIYVLDQGSIIAEGTPTEIQANAQVQAAYLGSAAQVVE